MKRKPIFPNIIAFKKKGYHRLVLILFLIFVNGLNSLLYLLKIDLSVYSSVIYSIFVGGVVINNFLDILTDKKIFENDDTKVDKSQNHFYYEISLKTLVTILLFLSTGVLVFSLFFLNVFN